VRGKQLEQALALDPNLAEAHVQIGQIKRLADSDWTGANASLQRALELDPGNSAVLNLAAELFNDAVVRDCLPNHGEGFALGNACWVAFRGKSMRGEADGLRRTKRSQFLW
jgi:tetratricopeptide (TPR) repeat protein